ncbi:MAG TPA: HTTM domain-containing protein [Roseiflexaceae bacterium]|nr:HTTM domain-containing protein [Roseiflexaceae bacterium]
MIHHLRSMWQRAVASSSHKQHRIGANLFRIGVGITILWQYMNVYPYRQLLFGPDGVLPSSHFVQYLDQSGSFSLYALAPSSMLFELIFLVSMAVTFVWMVGWQTRVTTPLTWLCLWSIHQRNPAVWDGGDNLIQIVLIFAFFIDLSPLRRLHSKEDTAGAQIAAQVHNAAVLAVGLQLCLVYAAAGLYKVQGALWQSGTALSYILRVGDFAWTGYGALLSQYSDVGVLLTYGTIAFQISFPFLFLLGSNTRRIALVGGVCFHLGIAIAMGLTTFAAFLICIELLFISDRDYLHALQGSRRLWHRLTAYGTQMRAWLLTTR